ncbi:MAG: zinc-ribbon domain-containing protein [Alphaproteobacteria bacterium]|nr:zinc-ribbon domain-containing protein [Alphaproteobacteria bacterium]
MLIKCPNCSVTYEIPEEIGLVEGRKLKCSDCNHVFVYSQSVVVFDDAQNNLKQENNPLFASEESVLTDKEEVPQPEVFLPESVQEPISEDDLSVAFTPVEPGYGPVQDKYRLPRFVWAICLLLLFCLGCAGFYYADFISADYLLGVNRNRQTEMDIARRRIAEARRTKLKQSHQAFVERARQKAVAHENAIPVFPVVDKIDVVGNKGNGPDEAMKKTEYFSVAEQETSSNVLDVNADDAFMLNPVVMYKDKEVIHEADGNINVRMRGSIQNPSKHELVLPPVVHAVAFDENGKELFSKDIYLTNRYLDAGQTQDFFGSYSWHPENPNVQIQWIDMSF